MRPKFIFGRNIKRLSEKSEYDRNFMQVIKKHLLNPQVERRIAEKDEEFEATRKNHQRAIESMQASLEAESKGRADALKSKKKLETDINELEVGLDGANRSRSEAEKNVKKFQQQLREAQQQVSFFFLLQITFASFPVNLLLKFKK